MGGIPAVSDLVRVSEIFGPTIQGEGALIGQPTVFVRTGGCDYRCSWCDSLHAVEADYRHTWAPMTPAAIMAEVARLSGDRPLMVTLSGGNPAIQPLGPLIAAGQARGYHFAVETQGSVARDWFAALDMLVLSPKPPSSGMEVDWDAFDACVAASGWNNARGQRPTAGGREAPARGGGRALPGVDAGRDVGPEIVLKIVIFDEADYLWAREVAGRYASLPLYLQPGNHTPPPPDDDSARVDQEGIDARMRWLVDRVVADGWFAATVLPQLHVTLWGNLRGV
ncbi:MAG: 7-carboxy-7-deazaguanine synthase QueE [Roseovarius sp.]|nr:7-carboxy-7-deazaguanine synthase QueE [Roseovarius sp.]